MVLMLLPINGLFAADDIEEKSAEIFSFLFSTFDGGFSRQWKCSPMPFSFSSFLHSFRQAFDVVVLMFHVIVRIHFHLKCYPKTFEKHGIFNSLTIPITK